MADTTLSTEPTTLLQAVNALLLSVGKTSTDSLLDADTDPDVRDAFECISRASAQVQGKGWYWNTETFTIQPSVGTGFLALPDNVLKATPKRFTPVWSTSQLVARGNRLYDLKAHSFIFTKSADVECVLSLAFEDMPQAARWYLTCTAGKAFGVGKYPATGTYRFTDDEEKKAEVRALQEDTDLRDTTLPESSPHFARMSRR